MNLQLKTIALALFLISTNAFPDISLQQALKTGKVRVQASGTGNFRTLAVVITNPGAQALNINVTGSLWIPDENEMQPLAVARLSWDHPGSTITLAPGRTWKGTLACLCLDRSSGTPYAGTSYNLSTERLPTQVESVLVAFQEGPRQEKESAQYAIWQETNRPAHRRIIAQLAGTLRFLAPPSNQVVVLPGRRFVLTSEGVVHRYLDSADGQTITREYTGGGFYRLYRVGSELNAVRRTAECKDGNFLLYQFKEDSWRRIGALSWFPETAVAHPVWGPVFGRGNQLYAPIQKKSWTVDPALRGMALSADPKGAEWVALTEAGRQVSLAPENGNVTGTSATGVWRQIFLEPGLLVRQGDQLIEWSRRGELQGQRRFLEPIQEVRVAGVYASVRTDENIWILREDDSWVYADIAGKGYTSMDVDARTGAVYFLNTRDHMRVVYAR